MPRKYVQKPHKMTKAEIMRSQTEVGTVFISRLGKKRKVIAVGANSVVFENGVCYTFHDLINNNFNLYGKSA